MIKMRMMTWIYCRPQVTELVPVAKAVEVIVEAIVVQRPTEKYDPNQVVGFRYRVSGINLHHIITTWPMMMMMKMMMILIVLKESNAMYGIV
jgi:hypothetical protein